MHGVCKDGGNCGYSHDLSDMYKYFQQGYCVYGDGCKYEHSKPLKQEEAATAAELTTKSSLAASSSLSSIVEMNTSEAESRNSNFATVGAGSEDWVNAIEFVPGQPYCGPTVPSFTEAPLQGPVTKEESEKKQIAMETKKQLCPFAANCVYLHGDSCDMCGPQVLHPMDAAQRSQRDIELSFAVQRSKDMVCGICMEVVYEKSKPQRCICTRRSAEQFESKIIKSCPECQITSNLVVPSEYWVEEKEEKQKLVQKYKEIMSNKACTYFDERHGSCPFGGNCFYKREEPQRQKVGTLSRYGAQQRSHFWELIEERENSNPFDNKEEVVIFELGKMMLMLLASGRDNKLTD
uniref:RING-type E3 ubiquitin transferase n=1 Tax=Nomascus leucogenys TaxID=61853 RepID=A0A2I3H4E2_NOMLE